MGKVNRSLHSYWCFVKAHRSGDPGALKNLELLATGYGKQAKLAKLYCEAYSETCRSKDAAN